MLFHIVAGKRDDGRRRRMLVLIKELAEDAVCMPDIVVDASAEAVGGNWRCDSAKEVFAGQSAVHVRGRQVFQEVLTLLGDQGGGNS